MPAVRIWKLRKDGERTKRPGHSLTVDRDTAQTIANSMYDEYKEPLYAAPPLLQRMVDAGRLGRKTGSGFYSYA